MIIGAVFSTIYAKMICLGLLVTLASKTQRKISKNYGFYKGVEVANRT